MCLLSSGATVLGDDRPAQAAGCFADGCEGKWPGEQGCVTDRKQILVELPVDESGHSNDTEEIGKYDFKGNGWLYYSPECRATWAEFVMSKWETSGSKAGYSLEFQLWAQPQYGGRRYRPAGPVPGSPNVKKNFMKFDGQANTYRSVMVGWSSSVQMCSFHDVPGIPIMNPDVLAAREDGTFHFSCTVWM